MKREVFEYEFEVECPHGTVDYVIEYTVDPGERGSGPTYDCAGTPDYPPCIEDASAYYLRRDRHGRVAHKERRPELDDAVSEDTLLEHAGATEEAAREAAAEARWEASRER